MTREEALKILRPLMSGETISETAQKLASSRYPELEPLYWEYIYSRITPQELLRQSVHIVRVSHTKLHQALK